MSEYRETIKNLSKVRGYVRDLYLYGFRTRNDFERKSARSCDNERRRVEGWLSEYIRFDNTAKGKSVCISLDSASVESNPLYVAWKSKSFTDNDIALHFLISDILADGQAMSAPEMTDAIAERCGTVFELQTVRGKLREYEREGILIAEKQGKSLCYRLSDVRFSSLPERARLNDAAAFFSQISVGGYIGSTISCMEEEYSSIFRFKHRHIAHTLDDSVTLSLLEHIRDGRACRINGTNKRTHHFSLECVPLNILDSVPTGRRYVTVYEPRRRKLSGLRIDCIDSVDALELCPAAEEYRSMNDAVRSRRWGVSYSGSNRVEQLCVKLHIDDATEKYVLERIAREGRGGELLRLGPNTYLYTVEVFDSNEVMPWIRTLVGRIISLEGTNRTVVDKFYADMKLMAEMYRQED